jgi:hypothetical protein
VLKMGTLLCFKMLVCDYQLVLHLIAVEQNAHKCGWIEISDIIPFFTFMCLHFLLFH